MADQRHHHQLQPASLACTNCVTQRAVVYCSADGARLCLECDGAVHGASPLLAQHPRAPLCDACAVARAAIRCKTAGNPAPATLCDACADRLATQDGASLVQEYTGCPTPAEILRLLSVDAPPLHEDFDAWLADKLPQIMQDVQLGLISWQRQQLLPPSICQILSSSYSCYNPSSSSCQPVMTSTTLLQSMGSNDHHPSLLLDGFPTFCPSMPLMSPPPPPPENGTGCHDANQPSQMLPTDEQATAAHHQQDPSTIAKKREERDRAKQRYNEKKKNRK
ncbi:zinc finger protein CONSTANS-LIKE 14-like [Hordeum vulgare subsp. vulgare]|uniref:zinc finger protein CONSTANS-LIKE 14-like n=1 Tax=Hordeum vulgare subsp. vulgare TaxID=112509 RepID=UPI001D1A5A69|nr:zinc finger protein CONSTANS-LIKE 14-like [Hordeum vulgare subsp. vulgare]